MNPLKSNQEPFDFLKLRIATGFDSHKYQINKPLIIGGINIPFEFGLKGHSDGDVLIHSLIDGLISSCSDENIGTLFPDTDSKYKDISSLFLLKECADIIEKKIELILSADFILILNQPHISNFISAMKKNIAAVLPIDLMNISIKAKRNELNLLSAESGVISFCTLLLKLK